MYCQISTNLFTRKFLNKGQFGTHDESTKFYKRNISEK